MPDLTDVVERARYAGRHVVVAGSGHSALTALAGFAALVEEEPGTKEGEGREQAPPQPQRYVDRAGQSHHQREAGQGAAEPGLGMDDGYVYYAFPVLASTLARDTGWSMIWPGSSAPPCSPRTFASQATTAH